MRSTIVHAQRDRGREREREREGESVCESLFWLSECSSVSLTILQKKNPVRNRFQERKQMLESGCCFFFFLFFFHLLLLLLLLPPPTGGESSPFTIRFRPSVPHMLIDACQSVSPAGSFLFFLFFFFFFLSFPSLDNMREGNARKKARLVMVQYITHGAAEGERRCQQTSIHRTNWTLKTPPSSPGLDDGSETFVTLDNHEFIKGTEAREKREREGSSGCVLPGCCRLRSLLSLLGVFFMQPFFFLLLLAFQILFSPPTASALLCSAQMKHKVLARFPSEGIWMNTGAPSLTAPVWLNNALFRGFSFKVPLWTRWFL